VLGEFNGHPKEVSSMPLYWVLSEMAPGATLDQYKENLKDHLKYQFESERAGKLFAAGPLGILGRDEPIGFYILFCGSEEEARGIVEKDPFHARGVKKYQIKLWNFHESSIIGVGVRAWLNGTDTSYKGYWPPKD
jgi:uncharacterized protein YciI